jgi:hypothetical protein
MFDLDQEALIVAVYPIRIMQTCVPHSYKAEDISQELPIIRVLSLPNTKDVGRMKLQRHS